MTRSPGAQRIVDAAGPLFAERGYQATTIADLERGAGLTPRAGGIYRHFASKQAVLEAVLDDAMADMATRWSTERPPPHADDLAGLLTHLARVGLDQLDRQRPIIRILFRDLEAFPDLRDRVREGLIRSTYRLGAQLLRTLDPAVDAEAMAAVAIGSVVNYRLLEVLVGEPPGGVDEDRFVSTWVEVFAARFPALEVPSA